MKLIVMFLMTCSMAFAGEVVLFDEASSTLPRYDDLSTAIQINTQTNQGFIRMTGTETYSTFICRGSGEYRDCDWTDRTRSTFKRELNVSGLSMEGDKLVYRGDAGAVECATLGLSRIFRIPTLYMTGNCSAVAKSVKIDGIRRAQLKFVTK